MFELIDILAVLIVAALFAFVGSLAAAERGLLKRRIKRLEAMVGQLDQRTVGLTDIAEMSGALQRGQRERLDRMERDAGKLNDYIVKVDEAVERIIENYPRGAK